MIRILAIVAAVGWLAAGLAGWLLKGSYERNGKLQNANAALVLELGKLKEARREREQTEDDVRRIPDGELGRGLRE